MNGFTGLYGYEIVLMLLGIALFLVLLVALLRNVFKDKPYAKLLPAFLISVVMIGYPSIESVQYSDGMVEIQTATNQLEKDPANQQAQATLRDLQTKIAPRTANDPAGKAVVEKAQSVLDSSLENGLRSSSSSSRNGTQGSKPETVRPQPRPIPRGSRNH